MTTLRSYQQAAVDAVFDYWAAGGGNPLVDMATGTGKSVVIGEIARRLCAYPSMRVLMAAHRAELIEQNFLALRRSWPDAPAGIYAAGLGRRDTHHRVIVAMIDSAYKRGPALGPRGGLLIDEAHLVPNGGEGKYRTLIKALLEQDPDMRIAGFSATPFRMDSGRLDEGDGHIFDDVVFSYGIRQGIEDGYLAPLISKGGVTEIDVSNVARRGGEFVPGALEAAADNDDVTRAAVTEILTLGADRRSILAFCTGVKQAHHVAAEFRSRGVNCQAITGDTPKTERRDLIRDFREGRLRALSNCDVLTTGFDAPGVDLIACLRPTLSTGLYVQFIGRGTRVVWPAGFNPDRATAEQRREAIARSTKPNCLVLDYAGVVRRHGPVDTVEVMSKKAKGEATEAKVTVDSERGKRCPECDTLVGFTARTCTCGYTWPEPEPQHAREADDVPILSSGLPGGRDERPVMSWSAQRWLKEGAPDTVRVTYMAGLQAVSEWLCPEHEGPGRRRFEKWWREFTTDPAPDTVDETLRAFEALRRPDTIITKPNGRWLDVQSRRFASEHAA